MEEQIMKKIFRIMAVLATVAAFAASCSKADIEGPDNGQTNEGRYDGPVKTLTFEASIGEPQTKTSLGEVNPETGKYPVVWEAGDEIKIVWGTGDTDYVNGTLDIENEVAMVTVDVPETAEHFYAVYPATTTATVSVGDDGAESFTIEIPTQTGTFKKANIMVAKCTSEDTKLSFKHSVSMVHIKTGEVGPGKIQLYSGLNRPFIRGAVTWTENVYGDFVVASTRSTSDKYARVNASEANTDYYFALWPDIVLEDGFVAAFTEDKKCTYYHDADISIARGEILSLGNLESRIKSDYYIAETAIGKKDGSSWENAADIQFVRDFFAKPADNEYAYVQQMKLDNTTFWFEGGKTFVLGTEENPRMELNFAAASRGNMCPVKFYGGCTKNGQERDLDVPTVFSGNGEYGILAVRNKADLTLDGFVLENAHAVKAHDKDGLYGAALYVGFVSTAEEGSIYKYQLSFADYAPKVHVNNCVFKNNHESDSSINNDDGGGSAINLKAGKVYVNNTLFTGNTSYNRGPVHSAAVTEAGTCIFFNACRFTQNSIMDNYGSVMRHLSSNTKVALNGCTFGKNNCEDKCNSQLTITSPCVLTNNTIIEDTGMHKGNNVGIVRAQPSSGAGNVMMMANNLILDESEDQQYCVAAKNLTDYRLDYNITGKFYLGKALAGTEEQVTTSKLGVKVSELTLEYTDDYIWTWNGTYEGFTNATAAQLVAATKPDTFGEDFYDWLVEIGAIVNGQFTDCRGWLRPAESMCPGAYDPNATAPAL